MDAENRATSAFVQADKRGKLPVIATAETIATITGVAGISVEELIVAIDWFVAHTIEEGWPRS